MGRGRLGLCVVGALVVVLKLGKAEGPAVLFVVLGLLAAMCVDADGLSFLRLP